MAGTYLQQDFYGEIRHTPPSFNKAMSDHHLVELVRNVPAVASAHKSCDWVVVTAMYQDKAGTIKAAHTHDSTCWLAFVDRGEHSVGQGWTKIPLVLFSSYERNENIFKVMMPAVLPRHRIVFVNHALPQSRCLKLPHLVRGKELEKSAFDRPHLLASKIPGWSGRAVLPGQLEMTRGYLERRNATADLADFEVETERMARSGFNTSARLPVVDTLWMIWPSADEVAEKMSRLWLHEVARFSCFEKVSYPWVIWQVPEFKARLTDAIYIYSPEQRVCPGENVSAGSDAGRKIKRRLGGLRHARGRRMRNMS
mmetsp:Transcript_16927/g.43482  ORF Transcript_16927/g.43482 Transcript_16927/m.43482 type:complete len:311 (+) Transcript_16927:78-1010(+)